MGVIHVLPNPMMTRGCRKLGAGEGKPVSHGIAASETASRLGPAGDDRSAGPSAYRAASRDIDKAGTGLRPAYVGAHQDLLQRLLTDLPVKRLVEMLPLGKRQKTIFRYQNVRDRDVEVRCACTMRQR